MAKVVNSDFTERLIRVRRVTKVVKGGKKMSFAALVIVGDGKGRVGFANGKAGEVADAVRKAGDKARKNMFHIPMKQLRTLHHDVAGHWGASKVVLRMANPGRGIIAGGAAREMLNACGLKDVVSKLIGSTNPDNVVRAVMDAFKQLQSPKNVAFRLGKNVNEILKNRKVRLEKVEVVKPEAVYGKES